MGSGNTVKTLPLVSVVMPAYNAEQFIAEAIQSVLAQSETRWELLVIDDCSTDSTRRIVEELAREDARIKLICNGENMGVARTRNRGLELCRGKYVALLDSDDYYKPQMLQKMVARAEETKADIVYCSYEIVDEQGQKLCNDFTVPKETDFAHSLVQTVISCSTAVMTDRLAKKYQFPTDMYHEDTALWLQILRDGCVARGVPEVLAAYRQRANSRSSDKLISAFRRWTIYRKYLKMPFLKSALAMARYAYYGLIKYKRV